MSVEIAMFKCKTTKGHFMTFLQQLEQRQRKKVGTCPDQRNLLSITVSSNLITDSFLVEGGKCN